MKNLIITKEQLTNYVNESPIKNKEFSTDALFIVINKIIDDEKIDRYSKYIADKDNPNVRSIFVKITNLVLPKVNKGAGIIIDNYTGRIYQKNYTIEPKDLDIALALFNSMNTKGLLYHYFDSSNESKNIQTKEINKIIPQEHKRYKLYESHGDTYILPHTKRIIDIKPECIDITIGAKLLVDKYLLDSKNIEHKVSLGNDTSNIEVKINSLDLENQMFLLLIEDLLKINDDGTLYGVKGPKGSWSYSVCNHFVKVNDDYKNGLVKGLSRSVVHSNIDTQRKTIGINIYRTKYVDKTPFVPIENSSVFIPIEIFEDFISNKRECNSLEELIFLFKNLLEVQKEINRENKMKNGEMNLFDFSDTEIENTIKPKINPIIEYDENEFHIDCEIKQQNIKQTSKQVISLFDFYGIDVA